MARQDGLVEAAEAPPPQAAMFQLIIGKWVSQSIAAAAELGMADLLAHGSRGVEELAAATKTDADSLYRLLRGLSSVAVFAEDDDGKFRNTPLSDTLRRDQPGSIRGFARLQGMEMAWRAWGELAYSVRTGRPAFDYVAGSPTFEYIGSRPDQAEIVNEAMTSLSELSSGAIVEAYDFAKAGVVVDVGGGQGLLLATILHAHPHLKGILYELPHAVDGAARLLTERGLRDRAQVIAGNALERVVPGGDVYLVKHIIHDWDDERALIFRRNVPAVLPSGGRLLVIEAVLGSPGQPHFAKLLDLEMLIMSAGGRERTLEEYRRLFAAVGVELVAEHPTRGPHSVIEGLKR